MKITVKSPGEFKQQLLDAGVPPAQIKAALAHVEKSGPLKGGMTVSLPDAFTREDGAAAARKAMGDKKTTPDGSKAKGGRAMGSMGIHAFDKVDNAASRRAVDACGYPIGPDMGVEACGGGRGAGQGGGGEAPARRTTRTGGRATVDACGYPLDPGPGVDACGGGRGAGQGGGDGDAPVRRPARTGGRSTVDACGYPLNPGAGVNACGGGRGAGQATGRRRTTVGGGC